MRPAVPLYWRCTPAEWVPSFDEAGLIHDQDAVGAEPVDHEGADVVADGVGAPAGGAQQPSQGLRAARGGVFG